MTEREAWIAFSCFTNIGPARLSLIRKYFGMARKAWKAPIGEYKEIGFSDKLARDFEKFRQEFDLTAYLSKMKNLKTQSILLEDKNYPENLKKIEDSLILLYVRIGSIGT